jgi:hypothetical protein
MANVLNFSKVTALPVTFSPSTLYFIPGSVPDEMHVYVSDSTGTSVKKIIDRDDIIGLINTTAPADNIVGIINCFGSNEVVATGNYVGFLNAHKVFTFDKVRVSLRTHSADADINFALESNMDPAFATGTLLAGNKTVELTGLNYTTTLNETITVSITSTTNTTGKGLIALLIKS